PGQWDAETICRYLRETRGKRRVPMMRLAGARGDPNDRDLDFLRFSPRAPGANFARRARRASATASASATHAEPARGGRELTPQLTGPVSGGRLWPGPWLPPVALPLVVPVPGA